MPLNKLDPQRINAPDKGFELIPNGTYVVEVAEAKEASDDDPTKDYLKLTLRIIDDADYAGRRIFQNLWYGEKSEWYTKMALQAILQEPFDPEVHTASSLEDRVVIVTTNNRTGSDGKERTEVKSWMPFGSDDTQSDTGAAKASIATGRSKRASAL